MSLRLIGGRAKSFSLPTPPTQTRPTLVQLRRRLFDFWQSWEGETVIDLCAGSGSLGMEAWSRGAKVVHLVESDRQLCQKLKATVTQGRNRYPELGEVVVHQEKVLPWLKRYQASYTLMTPDLRRETTLFFDPPYEDHRLYQQVAAQLASSERWFEGIVIIETDELKGLPVADLETLMGKSTRRFTQGGGHLLLFDFRD